ncbi:hypothetical protein [uncultured Microscilla sp.]|uniref:hypothetical protein n=1 Tax=uncultured Microscilla sp. TaxID=432653 RepID=UPI00261A61DE|nr:hypothetical protein [uncultured Microscilla sp.]
MNHSYKKYQEKPEEQQLYTKNKNSKKLLQALFLMGDGDDVIVRKIINLTRQVPFTEKHAKDIEDWYQDISEAKRSLFKKTPPNFETVFGHNPQKPDKKDKEEYVPSKDAKPGQRQPLPTHTIEMRKEAYKAYKGAELYLDGKAKEQALKLLKTAHLLGFITVNGVRSSEAIKAFELLEKCGPLYTDLFFRDHPKEAGYLTANLPVEFLQQHKTAFQRGFTRYNYATQDKKTIEEGKKDPSKYKAPRVVRDNKAELFKMIQQALDKEVQMTHVQEQDIKTDTPTKPNSIAPHPSSGIELYLAIAVEAGLEDKELQTMLNSAAIRSDRRAKLQAKYPTAFDPKLLEEKDKSLVQGKDKVTHGNRNASTAGLLANIAGTVGSGAVGVTIGKHRLKNIKLLRVQGSMAGTLAGLKLATDKDDEYKPEDYKKWLESKAGGLLDPKTSKADRRDLKHAGKLDANKINLSFDLLKKRRGEKGKGQKNRIKAFVNALPFDGLNYISGDKSIVSDEGVIKHVFAHISWDATRGKAQEKSQLAQVKIFLKEVLFNNFRAVMFKDSYNMGKLQVTDIEIDLTQVIEKSGFRQTALIGLYDLLMNPTMLTTAMLFHVIARFQGQAAMVDTKKALLEELKKMPMDFTSLKITLGGVNLEHFYGATLGGIGKIGLSNTSLEVSAQQKPDKKDDDKYTPTVEKKKNALEEIKVKRNVLQNEIAKLERQISSTQGAHTEYQQGGPQRISKHNAYVGNIHQLLDKKRELLNQLEKQQFPEKIQALEKQIKDLETNQDKHNAGLKYAIRLSTNQKVQMKDAQLLQEMMREMLLSGLKESGVVLEGLEGLTDIELPQGLSLDLLLSANDIKNMGLEVKQVKIPNTLKASRFQYDMQVKDKEGKAKKDSQGNDLVSLRVIGTGASIEGISLGVRVNFKDIGVNDQVGKDEGMLDNVTISQLKADSFKFKKLWLKMPEPTPKASQDNKKAPPPQKMQDVAIFSTASEVKNIEVDFDMKTESLSLNFEKMVAQSDKNIQIDSKFASKDESSALSEQTQLLLQKVEGLEFEMNSGGAMMARVGNVTVPQIVLQQLRFKNETFSISHNQDDDRKVKTAVKQVVLQNLEFVMDKKGYYIKQLDKLSIEEVFLSGTVTYKGKDIPLKNGSIKGIEANDLRISIEKGKSLLQMVQEGSARIDKINLPKIVYATVGHLDLFDIGKIKIDRITEEGKEGIDYSIGSIKAKGGGKAGGKNLSGGLSTSVGGKYTESKDGKGKITKKLSTHLNNTQLNTEMKNKVGKKEAAAGLSAQKISFETDLSSYATVSLGAALSLDHIFYEAEDGTYVKNLPGGAPLQLLNPRAKVTFVKKKVKNKEGVEELKTVAYNLQYLSISKLVARNLEAGNKKMGLKLLVPSDKEASLNNIALSGELRTKDSKLAMKATTKGLDIQEIKANFKNQILVSPYLKANSLSFSRDFAGNMDATIKGLDMGLLTASPLYARLTNKGAADVRIDNPDEDKPSVPIFRAGKIKMKAQGKNTKVIISDPILGEIAVKAGFVSYDKSVMLFNLDELRLRGSLKGDLVIEDSPSQLTIESLNDMQVEVPHAKVSGNVFKLHQQKKKKQKKPKKQGKKQTAINPYGFLDLFGGSQVSITLFGQTATLQVRHNVQKLPGLADVQYTTVSVADFLATLGVTAAKGLMGNLQGGTIGIYLPELMKIASQILGSKMTQFNKNEVRLSSLVVFLENLDEAQIQQFVKELIEKSLPFILKTTSQLSDATLQRKPALAFLIRKLLKATPKAKEYIKDYAKGKIKELLNDPGTNNTTDDSKELIPDAVEEMVRNAKPKLAIDILAKADSGTLVSRGKLNDYTQSDFTKGDFKIQSSIVLQFITDKKNQTDTKLTINNTVFEGFSYPLAGGRGKLSTKRMHIGNITAYKEHLKETGKSSLEANFITFRGFKLHLKKSQQNNPKAGKGGN